MMVFLFLIQPLIVFGFFDAKDHVTENNDRGVIKISVTNIKNTNGHLIISLYNKAEGFPSEMSSTLLNRKYEIVGDKLECEFVEIPYGEYAVAILHDENDNGELDKNLIGIPKEGVGVSNNAMRTFGPPRYEDSKFVLKSNEVVLSVKLHYY